MALTAYAGVRSLSISPSSSGAQVIDERHAGKCLGIHLYPNAREVTADSRSVELSSGEYALLEFLVIRCDRLVRYEEIYAGGLTASIDTVQTEVSTIRRKLGLGKSVIKNKTSAGYIIASRSLCPFMERRDS
jgi:DNA-binding response OmpR family regulator